MKKTKLRIIKDAATLLGFPWSKPAEPTARSTTSSGFIATAAITDANLKEMFRRNQAAHTIVEDVARDSVPELEFRSPKDKELEEWNAEANTIFEKFIMQPIIRAIFFTRLYGYCGILIGYADGKDMAEPVEGTPELNISSQNKKIDASRMIHVQNQSTDEESLTGESSLICLYDILTSLKSMDWAVGQGMWRNAGGMTVFIAPDSADPQTQIDAIDEVTTDINAMTVLTMPPGTEVVTGATGALNPLNYYTVAMEQIAVGSRIPVSILRGSVAGALSASEKDRKDYQELLHEIQKTQVTPAVRNLLQKFQASGQLSEQEFIINWKLAPTLILEEKRGKLLDAQAELTKTKALEIAEGMTTPDPLNLKEK
jgi:hypothetical protein